MGHVGRTMIIYRSLVDTYLCGLRNSARDVACDTTFVVLGRFECKEKLCNNNCYLVLTSDGRILSTSVNHLELFREHYTQTVVE